MFRSAVQLIVRKSTRLLNVTRDSKSLNNMTQAGSRESSFNLSSDLQPLNNQNQPALQRVSTSFEGDSPKNVTSYLYTPNGTRYAVCTTIHFGYEPAVNSAAVTVEPQAAQVVAASNMTTENGVEIAPPKTPEQMHADAETKGLQVWGPDSFSIFPPFMKFHARVLIDWLAMDVHSWIGIGGCGIDSSTGFGRLLEKGFENVPTDMADVVNSAFISSIAATTTLFITSLIAATFTSMTPGYWLTLIAYSVGGASLLCAFYALADFYTARAVLFGAGATLLALLIGVYSADILIRSIPFMIQTELTGAEPVRLAVKGLVNTLVSNYLGATSIVSKVIFTNPLMIPFAVATLTRAAWAIYLGWIRR